MRETSLGKRLVGVACAAFLLAVGIAPAVAAETARELITGAKRLNDTTRSWKDRDQKLSLQIVDEKGRERNRELVMKTLRGPGGEDRTLTVFFKPAEVRGTAFLQFAHKDRDAEQWLYLPAFNKVRQISAQGKDESFVGTDFSYRDLELLTDVLEWSEDEARSSLLKTETVDGREQAVIELVPQKKAVGYSRIVIAISKPDLLIRRMEFYRDDPAPQKVLDLAQIKDVGAIPTAHRLEMSQPARGSRTTVDVSSVRYDAGLKSDLFTQNSLERAAEDAE